eukprot:m.132416 g.132416  ORF g.132416 m.132416 type:complete len:313 (+) comp14647_c0_seq3:34-972(+)
MGVVVRLLRTQQWRTFRYAHSQIAHIRTLHYYSNSTYSQWKMGGIFLGAVLGGFYQQNKPWEPTLQSPFIWSELEEGIASRKLSATQHRDFVLATKKEYDEMIRKTQEKCNSLSGKDLEKEHQRFKQWLAKFKEDFVLESDTIIYGTTRAHARQQYLDRWGCARWTEVAMNELCSRGLLIEIGAGNGRWAEELRNRGCDILAFDKEPANAPGFVSKSSVVQQGDHTVLSRYPDRTLFICYPPPMGDQNSCMAVQCLQFYKGDTFVYVGEGRGGSCASEGFFDVLERDWVCEKIIDLDPFEQCFERMFVMRRK